MNEQFILNKLPQHSTLLPDKGRRPTAIKARPSVINILSWFLSSFAGYTQAAITPVLKRVLSAFALLLLWLVSAPAQPKGTTNLSLKKQISTQSPAIGDSAVLALKATVLQRGVWFNTSEIIAADQTNVNSKPNNLSLVEDDNLDNDSSLTNNTKLASFTLGTAQPPGPSIGLALAVVRTEMQPDSSYNITYKATIKNVGDVALNGVVLMDSLIRAFSVPVSYSVAGAPVVGASVSTLMIDSLTFYNTALATAMTPDDQLVEDASTAGTNDDPANGLDPRNNSQPTPVSLNGLSPSSYLGLAMAVRDTTRQVDGSYNVTYQIVVKAYGPDALKNVTVSDTLSKVFNAQTGSDFSVVKTPIITSAGSALKLNLNYNGVTEPVLVLGDSTSRLAAGKADTILVVVNVGTDGSTPTFLNSAYGEAIAKSDRVSDISTNGLNPDVNGNGNPTDANEHAATPLNIQPVYTTVFIPQGFSPNGDGINDLFVVRGANGQTVSLEVYNRWGYLVYKNDDYRNDWGGKPNTGLSVGSDANGLPDGTYYYAINLSNGRKFVRYTTINR